MLPPNTSEYFIKMEKQNLNIFTVYIHVNVEPMFYLPIVSIRIMSYPAASQTKIASLVVLVTPPRVPRDGEARIKAFMSRDSSGILVLSPRSDPT